MSRSTFVGGVSNPDINYISAAYLINRTQKLQTHNPANLGSDKKKKTSKEPVLKIKDRL